MLQWQAVFAVLLVEMGICTIVILPLPLKYRRAILEGIDKLTKNQTVSTVLKVLFALLAFLFVDCVRSSMRVEEQLDVHDVVGVGHAQSHCEHFSRLFRAQRNAYMTGFALFLFLMIFRLKEMMMSLIAIEKKGAAVVSQAGNSQKEYERLLEEKNKFKAESETARTELKSLQEEVARLRSSEKAIKLQAENQSREYQRLLEENDALHDAANAKTRVEKKGE